MSLKRRDFIRIGSAGVAGVWLGGCSQEKYLAIRVRGLFLLEGTGRELVVRSVDAAKLGIAEAHRVVLRVRPAALDTTRTNLEPSRKREVGRENETWEWDLADRQVSILQADSTADSIEFDRSTPTQLNPGANGSWKSISWVPDLKRLAGASKSVRDDAFNCQITLREGRVEGDLPNMNMGKKVIWTFKKKNSNDLVQKQALTDTVLYTIPLKKRLPEIRIDSGVVAISDVSSKFISIENYSTAAPQDPNAPFSLGHFHKLYDLVDRQFETDVTAEPASLKDCSDCSADIEPFYCPPAMLVP
jgi:hypothetical protein